MIATDIQFAPWLDAVADAQHLPFAPGSAANIVMIDVLHHVEFPVAFFREAQRVLRPGGRVVMVEPAITWGSALFYRFLHHEPVRMSAAILDDGDPIRAATPMMPTRRSRPSSRRAIGQSFTACFPICAS